MGGVSASSADSALPSHPRSGPYSSSEARREGVQDCGQLQGPGRLRRRCSYKETARPLGGIQGADHLQLDSPLEAARSARRAQVPQAGVPARPSPTPQFKSINSVGLSFLYSPTLTPIHDYWKNHSLD